MLPVNTKLTEDIVKKGISSVKIDSDKIIGNKSAAIVLLIRISDYANSVQ